MRKEAEHKNHVLTEPACHGKIETGSIWSNRTCDSGSRGGGGHHNAVEEDAPPDKASCKIGSK